MRRDRKRKMNEHADFTEVQIGDDIDGYTVLEILASGGMGSVLKVKDSDDTEFAMKVPKPDGGGGTYEHRLVRFQRETQLTARMNHVGVIKECKKGIMDGLPYLILELIEGETLKDKLKFIGEGEAVGIVEKTARAAHYIHKQGVVHRDLKPANIILNGEQPVIVDFGLAHDTWEKVPYIDESEVWVGTVAYSPPEQACGKVVDARADVYALGVVLYELLTGKKPRPTNRFGYYSKKKLTPVIEVRDVSKRLNDICMKALEDNKEDRFSTAEEFANALRNIRMTPPNRSKEVQDPMLETWQKCVGCLVLGAAIGGGIASFNEAQPVDGIDGIKCSNCRWEAE